MKLSAYVYFGLPSGLIMFVEVYIARNTKHVKVCTQHRDFLCQIIKKITKQSGLFLMVLQGEQND